MRNFMSGVFSGLRFRLLLLVVLACAPLLALTLHTAWEDRRRQAAGWQQRCRRMVELAKQEEAELLGGTRQLLLAMAESSSVRSGNRRGCKKLLDELLASYPRYCNLGVVLTNGELLASAQPVAESCLTNHAFFQRTVRNLSFSIGDFPLKPTRSNWALNFGYPVFDQAGEVQAVVFAALDLHWFTRFGSELPSRLPREAVWTEIDREGRILARYPQPENWMGRTVPEPSLVEEVFSSASDLIETVAPNGVTWLYARAAMPSKLGAGKVAGLLGIPKQALYAQADHALRRILLWSGIALGVALGLGWLGSNMLVVRPIKALVRSSARLAKGDLSARTGLAPGRDELGQLTLAFDQMAQALEQRERERLRASHKLQVLSHRLVEVQESERRHIARELHDEIGQSLTAAEMNLQAALQAPGSASIERRLEDSIQAVERVLEQVHDLSLNLRPSMLDDLGLEPALRWYTQRQAALADLEAEFHGAALEDRMDAIIETECFRVAQEALTNVVRHARARSVTVSLSKRDGQLHVCVRDDGVGFDVTALRDQAVQGASLGLLSMEERATLAGGGLELHSVPGQGTEVHAWFPLKWKIANSPIETNEHSEPKNPGNPCG